MCMLTDLLLLLPNIMHVHYIYIYIYTSSLFAISIRCGEGNYILGWGTFSQVERPEGHISDEHLFPAIYSMVV